MQLSLLDEVYQHGPENAAVLNKTCTLYCEELVELTDSMLYMWYVEKLQSGSQQQSLNPKNHVKYVFSCAHVAPQLSKRNHLLQ